MKTITTKTKPEKIMQMFRDGEVNLKTKWGFIYLTGGILCKLQEDKHYIAIKGKWVHVN